MTSLSEKIRELRKARGISQEKLAGHLGVSFQAVSKWERREALPDVTLIPAIASFFGVSTDEIFGFNIYETEKNVTAICNEAYKYRGYDNAKSESILREGLSKYPGNDIILNNLLYTIDPKERGNEVIDICKQLIAVSKDLEVRLDATRILGETYFEMGDDALGKETIELIPEIYFTKPELKATFFDGDVKFDEAVKEQSISFERMIRMTWIIGEIYEKRGEKKLAIDEYEFGINVLTASKNTVSPPWTRGHMEEWRRQTLEDFGAKISALKNNEEV